MSAIDVMPFSTSAYIADTQHLTNAQHGAYLLILISMWRANGSLPNDDRVLANIARLSLAKWRKIAPTIRALMTETDGRLTQKRLAIEFQKESEKVSKNRLNGSSGGRAKSLKVKDQALANASESLEPPTNGTHSKTLFGDMDSEEQQESVGGAVVIKAPRARRPRLQLQGHLLPDDWQPSAQDYAFAAERGYRGQYVRNMVDRFKNYHHGKGTMMAQPAAYWRTWVLNEGKFVGRMPATAPSPRTSLLAIAMGEDDANERPH